MDFDNFKSKIEEIYNNLQNNLDGHVADYIPQLSKVNPELFGISICNIDGTRIDLGDTNIQFCLQSTSKPILYCIARDLCGEETVHNHVGYEPSGQKFNAFILDDDSKPHNPLINAGAIMTSSLICPKLEPSERFDLVKKYLSKMSANGNYGFDNSVFLSEKTHASRNRALAYFMQEAKAFPEKTDIDQTLEFYFQNCSILADTRTLSTVAATLANGGICPINNEKVFDRPVVRDCLSLMYTCGMYDFSGRFAFEIGLPAKSGVSGCVVVVIPNKMGICIWSPRLDKYGNSVRGVAFCRELIDHFPDLHIFNNLIKEIKCNKEHTTMSREQLTIQIITAASNGDLTDLERLTENPLSNLDDGDYDKRTALHLACANGHFDIVKFLIDHKAKLKQKDRWGNTPFHELTVNRSKNPTLFDQIIEYYEECLELNDEKSTVHSTIL